MIRKDFESGLLKLGVLFCLASFPSASFASKVYFSGVGRMNDSWAECLNQNPGGNRTPGVYGISGRGCGAVSGLPFKYNLNSCNIMISNLSENSTDQAVIKSFWIGLNYTYTLASTGQQVHWADPLSYADGSSREWLSSTVQMYRQSSQSVPKYMLYKYSHLNSGTRWPEGSIPAGSFPAPGVGTITTGTGAPMGADGATLNVDGYTGVLGSFRINGGETASLIIGNAAVDSYGAGPGAPFFASMGLGFLSSAGQLIYEHLADKPVQYVTCFGYIDIESVNANVKPIILATGTLESKAGSYLNDLHVFGARFATSGPSTAPPVGDTWVAVNYTAPASQYMYLDWGHDGAGNPAPNPACASAGYYSAPYTQTYGPFTLAISDAGFIPSYGRRCSMNATGGVSGSITASYPEITLNTPILINNGKALPL